MSSIIHMSFQVSKVIGCNLVRQNDLPFDFEWGACNSFSYPSPKILLCFDSSSQEGYRWKIMRGEAPTTMPEYESFYFYDIEKEEYYSDLGSIETESKSSESDCYM